jgi:hypothetical protein
MSAFAPIAIIERTSLEVRKVPEPEVGATSHRIRFYIQQNLPLPNSPRPPFHILFLAFMLIERCPACGHAHRLDLPGSGRPRDGCPLAN